MNQAELESILSDIQGTVARRRAAGEYPAGLEEQLEREFEALRQLTYRGDSDRIDSLQRLLDDAKSGNDDVSGLTRVGSRVPFVSIFHRIVRRVVARQVRGLAAQQREVNGPVIEMLELLIDDARSREDADRRMVAQLSKHVLDRIAVIDHLYFVVAELETRLRDIDSGK